MTNQILIQKVNEPLKTIFYLPHYASLLSKSNFKIDHAHCLKLYLLKCIILLEKRYFRIFQHSNIRNESRGANENHFLSYALLISLKVSKFKNWTHLLFKTVSAQKDYFALKTRFSNVSTIKVDESIKTSKNILEFLCPEIFVMKTNESIKIILHLACHIYL